MFLKVAVFVMYKLIMYAVARGPTSRMFILSPVLEIRTVGCTFQALGYISERSRAKRCEHGQQFSFVCFKLREKEFSTLLFTAHDSN